MTSVSTTREHIFNDDLLMNNKKDRGKTDREWAKEQFPEIFHLLDYERLQKTFSEYDAEANHARDWVRRLGFAAVVSATLALLALVTEPIWPQTGWTTWVALVVELGGMLGALIAVGGLWIWPWKTRWLHARLMTERIRQWHFQLMVRRGAEVEASCQPGEQANFEKQRDIWFDSFLKSYEGKQDTKLNALTRQNSQGETWLHDGASSYQPEQHSFFLRM